MLRGVSGRVQHLDRHIAETEQFTVAHAEEREIGGGLREQHVLGAGGLASARPADTWSA